MVSFVTGELENDLTLGEVLRLGMLSQTRSQATTRRKIKGTFKGLKERRVCLAARWANRGEKQDMRLSWR